ncbi:hypothetical protein ACNF49_18575 [Actinomadura sp. ATCC 39365]
MQEDIDTPFDTFAPVSTSIPRMSQRSTTQRQSATTTIRRTRNLQHQKKESDKAVSVVAKPSDEKHGIFAGVLTAHPLKGAP